MSITLGQTLRGAREAREWSVQQVASSTRIPEGTIMDLEDDRFSRFDSLMYLKGFIQLYSRELGVDAGPWLAALKERIRNGETRLDCLAPLPDQEPDVKTRPPGGGIPVLLAPILGVLLVFLCISLHRTFVAPVEEPQGATRPAEEVETAPEAGPVSNIGYRWIDRVRAESASDQMGSAPGDVPVESAPRVAP